MDNQNELSAAEANTLAATDPKAWVIAFLDGNGLSVENVDEFDSTEAWHGLDLIEVYEEGGGEGEGEHVEKVYAIAPQGKRVVKGRVAEAIAYVAFYGHYESYNGTEWDGEVNIVEPKDVTIVQYHTKG